jgi:hypothetical protein
VLYDSTIPTFVGEEYCWMAGILLQKLHVSYTLSILRCPFSLEWKSKKKRKGYRVEAKAARGTRLMEKQKKEEAKQHSCNSRWSQGKGGEVYFHLIRGHSYKSLFGYFSVVWLYQLCAGLVQWCLPKVGAETTRNCFDWEDEQAMCLL